MKRFLIALSFVLTLFGIRAHSQLLPFTGGARAQSVGAIAEFTLGQAALASCSPNPNANGIQSNPFQDGCPLPAQGLNASFAELMQVTNNTQLAALPRTGTFLPTTVYRQGFTTPGDGGGALYTYSATACSLNAGAGDNGSQVPASGGGCWNIGQQARGYDVRIWGAQCNGSTDDTNAFNAAISAQTSGGNILIPQNCAIAGTIALATQGVNLWCNGPNSNNSGSPTNLIFTGTGTGNGFNLGIQSDTGTQLYGLGVHGCAIAAPNRTGGYIFNDWGTSQTAIDHILINTGWALLNARSFNTLILDNVSGWYRATSGDLVNVYGGTGTSRSDVLVLNDVAMNGQGNGADGMLFDGYMQTVRMNRATILNTGTALTVENSAVSTSYYPQFFFLHDLEIDGAGYGSSSSVNKYGVNILAGSDIHIIDSDIDLNHASNACTSCRPFASSPDTSGSVTRNIYVANTALHGSPLGGAYINAQMVTFSNDQFFSLCQSTANCDSTINLAANSQGAIIANNVLNNDGKGGNNVNYGINVNAGAADSTLTGNNYKASTAGNVLNQNNFSISLVGGAGYNGAPITVTSCSANSTC